MLSLDNCWKFECHCSEKNCIGLVQGAADTSIEILSKYKLSDFIQSMLIEKGNSTNSNDWSASSR